MFDGRRDKGVRTEEWASEWRTIRSQKLESQLLHPKKKPKASAQTNSRPLERWSWEMHERWIDGLKMWRWSAVIGSWVWTDGQGKGQSDWLRFDFASSIRWRLTMMERKLILYEDLKEDYHHLLFSSDLRCERTFPPWVKQDMDNLSASTSAASSKYQRTLCLLLYILCGVWVASLGQRRYIVSSTRTRCARV